MVTTRSYIRRPRRAALSFTQMEEMWLGPSHHGSAFVSDEHKRAMWFKHRAKLMNWWGRHGKRPLAWWQFEAPEKGIRWRGYEAERSTLYEAGVLSEEERVELETDWREKFERVLAPKFSYCAGSGEVLTSDAARVAYLLWADVPLVLVDRWLAELEQPAAAAAEGEGEPGAALA